VEVACDQPFARVDLRAANASERVQWQWYLTDVPVETIRQVIDVCPDAEWRLIVALSRFAGLRCLSEHLALNWEDILWDKQRFVVRSCKTEHHGKAYRVVPIFPELRPYLEECDELAQPGSVWVIGRNRNATMPNGIGVNWRTQFLRLLKRAGVG